MFNAQQSSGPDVQFRVIHFHDGSDPTTLPVSISPARSSSTAHNIRIAQSPTIDLTFSYTQPK